MLYSPWKPSSPKQGPGLKDSFQMPPSEVCVTFPTMCPPRTVSIINTASYGAGTPVTKTCENPRLHGAVVFVATVAEGMAATPGEARIASTLSAFQRLNDVNDPSLPTTVEVLQVLRAYAPRETIQDIEDTLFNAIGSIAKDGLWHALGRTKFLMTAPDEVLFPKLTSAVNYLRHRFVTWLSSRTFDEGCATLALQVLANGSVPLNSMMRSLCASGLNLADMDELLLVFVAAASYINDEEASDARLMLVNKLSSKYRAEALQWALATVECMVTGNPGCLQTPIERKFATELVERGLVALRRRLRLGTRTLTLP